METVKLVGYEEPILIAQIMYVQARGSYTIVHLVSGETLLVCMGLTALHRRAPQLVKLHISYLANRNFLGQFVATNRHKGVVHLLDGTSLPVSRRYRSLFLGECRTRTKPVVNLTTGVYYSEVRQAARAIGSPAQNMWPYLYGKQKTLKDNRLRFAYPDEIKARQILHP